MFSSGLAEKLSAPSKLEDGSADADADADANARDCKMYSRRHPK